MVSFTHYLNHLSLTNKLVVVSDDIIPAATPRLHNIQYNNLENMSSELTSPKIFST